MATLQEVAAEAYECFEWATRSKHPDYVHSHDEEGTKYVRLKSGTPQWVKDMVYEAHNDMMVDDWRYACIMAACERIADEGADISAEFADSQVDVYTNARIEWLASSVHRHGYVDDAVENFGHSTDGVIGDIGMGQYEEAGEVFGLVCSALENEASHPGLGMNYGGDDTTAGTDEHNRRVTVCEWFALCDHASAGVVRHPILGDVPTCERCATKLDLELLKQ